VARKAKRETSEMARNRRDEGTTYAIAANNANEFASHILSRGEVLLEKNSPKNYRCSKRAM